MLPLEAVAVDGVGEDLVGEAGPGLGVAGAEGGGDPAEVGRGERAEAPPPVAPEVDDAVARGREGALGRGGGGEGTSGAEEVGEGEVEVEEMHWCLGEDDEEEEEKGELG